MRLHLDTATNNAVTNAGETSQSAVVKGSRDAAAQSHGPAGGDSIQLSERSALFNRLSADRAQRIQQLASLVQSGSYEVSSSRISGAIIGHAFGGCAKSGKTPTGGQ